MMLLEGHVWRPGVEAGGELGVTEVDVALAPRIGAFMCLSEVRHGDIWSRPRPSSRQRIVVKLSSSKTQSNESRMLRSSGWHCSIASHTPLHGP